MQSNNPLESQMWLYASGLVLVAGLLCTFVFFDSVRPARYAEMRGRLKEPLWFYTIAMGAYLGLGLAVQVTQVIPFAPALMVMATPFALAASVVYVLRVVIPKDESGDDESVDP
jgi:succinate dehydrogenase hydrophobic anchor subunit